jgi:hypothetical protein
VCVCLCVCVCIHMYAHLTYKALTSTYILYACIRVVNVYLCVHVHVHVISIHLYTENLHLILSGYMPISMVKSCISIHFSQLFKTFFETISKKTLYVNISVCACTCTYTYAHLSDT